MTAKQKGESMDDQQQDETRETTVLPGGISDPMQIVYTRFMAHYQPFGFHSRQEEPIYHPMPYEPGSDDELLQKEPWRLLLELYSGEQRMTLGLDLFGDVILGRGESQPGRIIIDLESYGAQVLGVSREHMMLRPTPRQLFAIDRGSTNGTLVNGARSGRGIAMPLKNEDLLSLGDMVLMVHIVRKPSTAE
jgi:hypothetical protein